MSDSESRSPVARGDITRAPKFGVAPATSTTEVASCAPNSTPCSPHFMWRWTISFPGAPVLVAGRGSPTLDTRVDRTPASAPWPPRSCSAVVEGRARLVANLTSAAADRCNPGSRSPRATAMREPRQSLLIARDTSRRHADSGPAGSRPSCCFLRHRPGDAVSSGRRLLRGARESVLDHVARGRPDACRPASRGVRGAARLPDRAHRYLQDPVRLR